MNIVVYGTGNAARKFEHIISIYYADVNIIAFTNSTVEKEGFFLNSKLTTIHNISEHYEFIVVSIADMNTVKEIKEFLVKDLGVTRKKVIWYWDFINLCRKQKIIDKYSISADEQMKNTVEWLKCNRLTVRNQYENNNRIEYEVFNDEIKGYPYVLYYGKKMYYPKDYEFEVKPDGKRYLVNIVECDQYEGSPHLYLKANHTIDKGDVIVDAGVAEGNFALRYIDIIDKAYLIESEPRWLEVLKLTFEPYKDKVTLIPQMLGSKDSEKEITLDTIVGAGRCDFIKMDIEGAEPSALLGAINVLKNNDLKLSVCAYHNMNDEKYITFILNALGYKTSHSEGRMFFMYDEAIDKTLDFRHGIIYGSRG